MTKDDESKNHAHRLTLFSVSAAMVGVCLTGVGLIGVMKSLSERETIIDELLTASAVLFLVSTALNFFTLRRADHSSRRLTDNVADVAFFLGLTLLLVACLVFTVGKV